MAFLFDKFLHVSIEGRREEFGVAAAEILVVKDFVDDIEGGFYTLVVVALTASRSRAIALGMPSFT